MRACNIKAFISMIVAAALALACGKLTTKADIQPILFKGIKSAERGATGGFIVRWDAPPLVTVVGYQIYLVDVTAGDSAGAAAGLALADSLPEGAEVVLSDLSDAQTPAMKGKLLQAVPGNQNSYEIAALQPGKYLIQVHAVADDGRSDANSRVAALSIESEIGYPGISSATWRGSDLTLTWPALVTTVKGDVSYTVYQGDAFNVPAAITTATSVTLSLRGQKPGTRLAYGVRSRDFKGHADHNTKVIDVTVPEEKGNTFEGCQFVQPRGADRIKVAFIWPAEKTDIVKIMRNGVQAFATRDRGVTEFLDTGLQEGEKYDYQCTAEFKDITLVGTKKLSARTLSSNPPTFKGITAVKVLSAHSVKVSWGVSTGVPADKYQVFANPGSRVAWDRDPVLTVNNTELAGTLTGLGDDLPYVFGVRSCSASAVCDFNEIALKAVMPSDGLPLTPGIDSLMLTSNSLIIKAPWEAKMGGIAKRLVYIKEDGPASTDINDYQLKLTVPVATPEAVPSELVYQGIKENTSYHVIVRDQDVSSSGLSAVTAPKSIFSGDRTPPQFAGISALAANPGTSAPAPMDQGETTLVAQFMPIDVESATAKSGATSYLVYIRKGGVYACDQLTPYQVESAAAYRGGVASQIVVKGLEPKTLYGICLKAKDKAGNISDTKVSLSASTLDHTPPEFDGLKTLEFSKEKGGLVLAWDTPLATDMAKYQILIWKGNPDPALGTSQTLRVAADQAATGTLITRANFDFGSGDTIYIVVNACDNGSNLPGGVENCTTKSPADRKTILLDDIEPPPGFNGISDVTDTDQNRQLAVQGAVKVIWRAPASWAEYKGFMVYFVDEVTSQIVASPPPVDCPCAASGCSEHPTSCVVSNLDPFRTYVFHVRAYDAAGNMTQTSTVDYSIKKRVLDNQAPEFSSALNLQYAGGAVALSWGTARDNQYAEEPGATLQYQVWRRPSTTFPDLTNPTVSDATLLRVTDEQMYTDMGLDFVSGQTYYYTICAVDSSANRRCDGNVQSKLIPDRTPPVITSFVSPDWDETKSTWSLTWAATDNTASPVYFTIYAKESADANDQATRNDTKIFGPDIGLTASALKAHPNVDTYVHYLLVAEDADQNESQATYRVHVNNIVTVTRVASDEGDVAGNKLIIIHGDGFKTGAAVAIGGNPCSNVKILSRMHISCTTPTGSAVGWANVRVSNLDGSYAELRSEDNKGYLYCSNSTGSALPCSQVCNKPSTWRTQAPLFASGAGTQASPWVICTRLHLDQIRSQNSNLYYQISDNIDLAGVLDFAPLTNSQCKWNSQVANCFQGYVEGGYHAILNWNYEASTVLNVGLFPLVINSNISRLGVLDFTVQGKGVVGALVGSFYNTFSGTGTLDGNFMTGRVSGSEAYSGGLFGSIFAEYNGLLDLKNDVAFATVTGASSVGGITGYAGNVTSASNVMFSGVVEGTTTTAAASCKVGGIAGEWYAAGSLQGLRSAGSVTCKPSTQYAGGLIGYFRGNGNTSVTNASSSSKVTGGSYVGGLFGGVNTVKSIGPLPLDPKDVSVSVSFSGSVLGDGGDYIGGIVGQASNTNSFTRVRNSGSVKGKSYVGGIVGEAAVANFDDAANSGVIAGVFKVGGIAGQLQSSKESSLRADGSCLSTVQDVTNSALIRGEVGNSTSATGGIIGWARGVNVMNATNSGPVTSAGSNVGGIVGLVETWRDNCLNISRATNLGNIMGQNNVGGILGYGLVYSSTNPAIYLPERVVISESSSLGQVLGGQYIGGLVGLGAATIEVGKSSGAVIGTKYIGGVAGKVSGSLINNTATGTVSGESYCGGLVGAVVWPMAAQSTITFNTSTGNVTCNTEAAGGLIGTIDSPNVAISRSYATGKVQGGKEVGGFIGRAYQTTGSNVSIQDCFASGDVTGNSNVGGFAGITGPVIKQVYSTGAVNMLLYENNMGGLIGTTWGGSSVSAPDSFWDVTTSKRSTSAGGVGYATPSMKGTAIYPASWTADVWTTGEGKYPTLTLP